eukprot:787406-Prymnesium_polylepis.1
MGTPIFPLLCTAHTSAAPMAFGAMSCRVCVRFFKTREYNLNASICRAFQRAHLPKRAQTGPFDLLAATPRRPCAPVFAPVRTMPRQQEE